MGYRDNGNFNINWNERMSSNGTRNPPHKYPDTAIRFLQAQDALNKLRNELAGSSDASGNSWKIHRGYIRNLDQPQLLMGQVPISKCYFQFNPQEIRQSVSMRQDIYNALLQPPEQLAQPLGSTVNFTFDLFFDRSHEVSQGRLAGTDLTDVAGRRAGQQPNADPFNPDPQFDVYDIGVMADLRVLFAVIGQGFSKEMLEFQKKALEQGFKTTTNQPTDGSGETGGESTPTTAESVDQNVELDINRLESAVNINYGNWGFLMPNPIRVMFSSLFMLDGFITATNVDYLKFSTKMVPVMCRVTMNMEAMYIGFARQETFLTKNMADAAVANLADEAAAEAEEAELKKALITTASRFMIAPAYASQSDWDNVKSYVTGGPSPAGALMPVWTHVMDATNYFQHRPGMFLGFPNVIPVKGGDAFKRENGNEVQTKEGEDKDDILKLFKEGAPLTISYDWKISVYGGGKTQSEALTESEARAQLSAKTYKSSLKLMGDFYGTETATDDKSWGMGTSGDYLNKARRRSIRGSVGPQAALANKAPSQNVYKVTLSDDVPQYIRDAYYIVVHSVVVKAGYSGRDTLIANLTKEGVYNGNSSFAHIFNYITWNSDFYTGDPAVPANIISIM
jgi:hypothetical protein